MIATEPQQTALKPSFFAHNTGDRVLWAFVCIWGVLLTFLSIATFTGYNSGMYDIGNMAQAIASVQRGQPLVFTYIDGPTSRLAFHVEFFYYILALPYMIWPDPRLLLTIQALLYALGAIPVYAIAYRNLDSRFVARCLALVYLLYPTVQTSVLFDLHGDTLAMPFLLFAFQALDVRAWRRYFIFIALALSCKFYVALPVLLLGGLIWWQYGERKIAVWTAVIGLTYGIITFLVIRPLFTTEETSQVHRGLNYITYYFGQIAEYQNTFTDRILSALIVFGPVMFIAWRGWRWLLPGLPVAAAALLSTGPGGSYDYRYHHYAIVVPFIIMAAIDGARRMREAEQSGRKRSRRNWRGDVGLTCAIVMMCSFLFVDTPFNPLFWIGGPGYGLSSSVYGVIPRDDIKDRFLAEQVPSDAALAVSNQLAAHLTNRDTLYLIRYPTESEGPRLLPQTLERVDYAIADALFDYYVPLDDGYGGGLSGDREAIGLLIRDPSFGLVTERDGLLMFERDAAEERILTNTLELLPDDGTPAQHTFSTQIELLDTSIEQTDPDRLRATFTWRRTGDFDNVGEFVAVSRLEGIEQDRIVHIPGYSLLPSWEWPQDQIVQETFDVQIPPDTPPGEYTWYVGWYNVGLPYSYATDERSLLPDSEEVVVTQLIIE